jgi:hypothetical protein
MIRAMINPRIEVSRSGAAGDDPLPFSAMAEPKSRKTCRNNQPLRTGNGFRS